MTSAERVPNLVIIGVSKAGTTSLFHYLGQHPEICPADVKEVRYFAPLRYGRELDPLATYTAHFAGWTTERYALEATPGYFYGGRDLARGMRATSPDVHALLSLREPVERCWSWFQFVKSRTRIPKEMTFDAYLDRCEELHRAGVDGEVEHQPFWGMGGGCYAEWLDDWIDEYDGRLKVLFFDDLARRPELTVKDTCAWLGLDTDVVDRFDFTIDNRTEQYRHRGLQKAALALNRRGERVFHRHQTVKRALRGLYYTLNRARSNDAMPPAARARLTEFYRPYNARLAAQLGSIGLRAPATWSVG